MSSAIIFLRRVRDAPGNRQMRQLRDFFHGLLQVTFAERALAGGTGLGDFFCREGFADGDQRDFGARASRGLCGALDAVPHGLQISGDCCHNSQTLGRAVQCRIRPLTHDRRPAFAITGQL